MGYMRHHAIIVSGCDLKKAHKKACEIFPCVSGIVLHCVNMGGSFFIPPDGSKEGWDESAAGDKRRQVFITYLKRKSHQWVEVQYGCDFGENVITRFG